VREWTIRHDVAGVENAGVDNTAPEFCILDSVYSTRRSVEGKHDGDRFEKLRYDCERSRICLCLRKSLVL